MAKSTIGIEEAQWAAESDARTLADADSIKGNPVRMKKAKQAAKRMAKEETARTDALRKIAGLRPIGKIKWKY